MTDVVRDLGVVEEWDGERPPGFASPVDVGDRIGLVRRNAIIVTTVTRIEGYAPDVVETTGGVIVDLVGWHLFVVEK